MKPDEKWRQLVAESHAARRVLDYALAPMLKKGPPSVLARPEKIRRQKKMPVSKLRLMRGTTSTFKSKSLLRKTLAIADIIIARSSDLLDRCERRWIQRRLKTMCNGGASVAVDCVTTAFVTRP